MCIPTYSGPWRHTGVSPAGPGLWVEAAESRVSSFLPHRLLGGRWVGRWLSPEARKGDSCPVFPVPAGNRGKTGSSNSAPPPSVLADAVHVCPARPSPAHPEHFPSQSQQPLLGSESPGQQLQGERSSMGSGWLLPLLPMSRLQLQGDLKITEKVPGGGTTDTLLSGSKELRPASLPYKVVLKQALSPNLPPPIYL